MKLDVLISHLRSILLRNGNVDIIITESSLENLLAVLLFNKEEFKGIEVIIKLK